MVTLLYAEEPQPILLMDMSQRRVMQLSTETPSHLRTYIYSLLKYLHERFAFPRPLERRWCDDNPGVCPLVEGI